MGADYTAAAFRGNCGARHHGSAATHPPRSRHLPLASTEGSLTENSMKLGCGSGPDAPRTDIAHATCGPSRTPLNTTSAVRNSRHLPAKFRKWARPAHRSSKTRGFCAVESLPHWRSSCPWSSRASTCFAQLYSQSCRCWQLGKTPACCARSGVPTPLRSRARIRSQPRPRAYAPTTPAPTSWSGPSRLFSRTVGARLPARTPSTVSLFFSFDSSPHQLTRAPAMSRGGGCCSKNDLSLSPSESESLRRSRLPR